MNGSTSNGSPELLEPGVGTGAGGGGIPGALTMVESILKVLNPPPVPDGPANAAVFVDDGDGTGAGVGASGAGSPPAAAPRLRLREPPRPGAGGEMLCCWRMCFAKASERVKDLSHSVWPMNIDRRSDKQGALTRK
jgi:hypothetical protein